MSKIYQFLPDFRALVRATETLSESIGFNHSVHYYESEDWIYFYKPVGSFVYCYESPKAVKTGDIEIMGLTKQEIQDLIQEFHAIEVPRMLYVSHITTTTTGEVKQ